MFASTIYGTPTHQTLSLAECLFRVLERSAKDWHFRRSALNNGTKPSDLKKALHGLVREVHAFKKRLKNLPDDVWSKLAEANELVSSARYESRIEYTGPCHPEFGHTGEPAITVLTGDPNGPLQTIEEELISALHQLFEMASVALQANPPSTLPEQKREPLERWILDMRNLWHGVLNREFKRDETANGEPISDATIFCVHAFAVLDKKTKSSVVLVAMKERIEEDNELFRDHPHWMENWQQRKNSPSEFERNPELSRYCCSIANHVERSQYANGFNPDL